MRINGMVRLLSESLLDITIQTLALKALQLDFNCRGQGVCDVTHTVKIMKRFTKLDYLELCCNSSAGLLHKLLLTCSGVSGVCNSVRLLNICRLRIDEVDADALKNCFPNLTGLGVSFYPRNHEAMRTMLLELPQQLTILDVSLSVQDDVFFLKEIIPLLSRLTEIHIMLPNCCTITFQSAFLLDNTFFPNAKNICFEIESAPVGRCCSEVDYNDAWEWIEATEEDLRKQIYKTVKRSCAAAEMLFVGFHRSLNDPHKYGLRTRFGYMAPRYAHLHSMENLMTRYAHLNLNEDQSESKSESALPKTTVAVEKRNRWAWTRTEVGAKSNINVEYQSGNDFTSLPELTKWKRVLNPSPHVVCRIRWVQLSKFSGFTAGCLIIFEAE